MTRLPSSRHWRHFQCYLCGIPMLLVMTTAFANEPSGLLDFSHVIWRTVGDDRSPNARFLIDFDTGNVTSLPAEIAAQGPIAAMRWMANEGIDAMGEGAKAGLIGIDLVARGVDDSIATGFPNVSAKQISGQFSFLNSIGKPGTPISLSAKVGVGPQATYLLTTREGANIVLQIIGWDESTGDMRLAYRIAKGSAPSTLPAEYDADIDDTTSGTVKAGAISERDISTSQPHNLFDLDANIVVRRTMSNDSWDRFIASLGVDLQVKPLKTREVRFHNMAIFGIPNEWFDKPNQAISEIRWLKSPPPWRTSLYRSRTAYGEPLVPATFIYKTVNDSMGLLQIVGWDDEKQTVRIRVRKID